LKSSDTWKRKCGYVKCGSTTYQISGKMSLVPISWYKFKTKKQMKQQYQHYLQHTKT
jgi:hypothetical protein